MGIDGK